MNQKGEGEGLFKMCTGELQSCHMPGMTSPQKRHLPFFILFSITWKWMRPSKVLPHLGQNPFTHPPDIFGIIIQSGNDQVYYLKQNPLFFYDLQGI